MDIEELVKKHLDANWCGEDSTGYDDVAEAMRDALTEMASWYEQRIKDKEERYVNCALEVYRLAERISQLEAERVPEGWQLVPTVPTQGMAEAYWLAYDECSEGSHLGICYAAMLAAAPQPAKEGE